MNKNSNKFLSDPQNVSIMSYKRSELSYKEHHKCLKYSNCQTDLVQNRWKIFSFPTEFSECWSWWKWRERTGLVWMESTVQASAVTVLLSLSSQPRAVTIQISLKISPTATQLSVSKPWGDSEHWPSLQLSSRRRNTEKIITINGIKWWASNKMFSNNNLSDLVFSCYFILILLLHSALLRVTRGGGWRNTADLRVSLVCWIWS